MHLYKPRQRVKIINIQIAVPADLSENEVSEGVLTMMERAFDRQKPFLLDWRYQNPKKQMEKIVELSGDPEEGESFLLPPMKMKKFSVCVSRTASAHRWIEVEAKSAKEAEERALDMAGSVDFSGYENGEPSYEADEIKEK